MWGPALLREGAKLPAYLRPKEAALHLGVSVDTVRRRVRLFELAALQVNGRIFRIETAAVLDGAPDVLASPSSVDLSWIADHLRLSRDFIYRQVLAGNLPMEKRRQHPHPNAPMTWVMPRRRWVAWLIDHTTGDEPWDS